MQILRSLLPALLAATTLASVAALAAEPSPAQTLQEEEESDLTPAQARTTWNCYTVMDGVHRGRVTIWWGHTPTDAQWACNNWISICASSHRGCYATPAH
jgi:hypothetical protein